MALRLAHSSPPPPPLWGAHLPPLSSPWGEATRRSKATLTREGGGGSLLGGYPNPTSIALAPPHHCPFRLPGGGGDGGGRGGEGQDAAIDNQPKRIVFEPLTFALDQRACP